MVASNPGYGLNEIVYQQEHFGVATDLPTTGRVVSFAPPDGNWYLSNVWYAYDVAGGASATGKLRKIVGDAIAPDAAAGATVVELTGVAGASTVDLTATARTLRAMTLIGGTGAVAKRTFRGGRDRLAWVSGGTVSPLAGVTLRIKWMRVP